MAVIPYTDGETNTDPIELTDNDTQLEVVVGTATQAGAISESGGSFGVEKTGAGTLVLTADNTYTGPTVVTGGTLHLAPDAGYVNTVSDFTIATGAMLSFAPGLYYADIGALSGGGDVELGDDLYLTSYNDVGEDTTFSGSIFDHSDTDPEHWSYFVACGGGVLTLTGDSAFGGFFEIDYDGFVIIDGGSVTSNATDQAQTIISGTLHIINGGSLVTTWIQNGGGTLIVDGVGSTATASDWTSIGTALSVENGGVVDSQADAWIGNWVDFPATATVSGTGSQWNITGLLEIGTDDLSDPYFSQAGNLTITAGGKVSADQVDIASVGALYLGDGGLAGTLDADTIDNNGAIVANFTDTGTLSADISGAGTLDKLGPGTLTLTGTSAYTGATTVAGGRLDVNGLIISASTVKAGATLGGNGTVGTITVQSGGTYAPGTSIGQIQSGNLVLAAGARFEAEIAGTGSGVGYDVATVVGTVSLAGAALDLALVEGFAPSFGQSFTVIENDGSDAVVGAFAGLAEGAAFMVDGRLMTITYKGGDGNDVVISKMPPTTITGTDKADLIDATHTVAGQPLPTDDADQIHGRKGKDTIDALGGDDVVYGQRGKDKISADDGNDWIAGGRGGDKLKGNAGDDVLEGGKGGDVLRGADGDDVLTGGGGKNKLSGGDGNDTFVFTNASAKDKITDFSAGDIIALAKSAFRGIGPEGTLKAKYFHDGNHAETRTQHVLYDEKSGWLLYAKKGSQTADPQKLVKIGKHLDHFDHHDILVI